MVGIGHLLEMSRLELSVLFLRPSAVSVGPAYSLQGTPGGPGKLQPAVRILHQHQAAACKRKYAVTSAWVSSVHGHTVSSHAACAWLTWRPHWRTGAEDLVTVP